MSSKLFLFRKPQHLIGLMVLVAIGGMVFAASSGSWTVTSREAKKADLKDQEVPQQSPSDSMFAVDRVRLDRHVIRALDALGTRFESPAQGRSIMTATLTRNTGEPRSVQLTITRELPDKLRVEQTSLTAQRTLGYDGSRAWVRGGSASTEDLRLIEMIVRDSVEHFVSTQARGDATLHLGDMFRGDDGSNANYDGPFYDILRVNDTFATPGGTESRPTLFYLNSRTGLLEKIVYERQHDAAKVEVEFGEWIAITNQKIPSRIVWKENGTVTNQLTITQVTFAPVAQDGIFTAPDRL